MKAPGTPCEVCKKHKGIEVYHEVKDCNFLDAMHNRYVSTRPTAPSQNQHNSGSKSRYPKDQRSRKPSHGKANLTTSEDWISDDDSLFGACYTCIEPASFDPDSVPDLIDYDSDSSGDEGYIFESASFDPESIPDLIDDDSSVSTSDIYEFYSSQVKHSDNRSDTDDIPELVDFSDSDSDSDYCSKMPDLIDDDSSDCSDNDDYIFTSDPECDTIRDVLEQTFIRVHPPALDSFPPFDTHDDDLHQSHALMSNDEASSNIPFIGSTSAEIASYLNNNPHLQMSDAPASHHDSSSSQWRATSESDSDSDYLQQSFTRALPLLDRPIAPRSPPSFEDELESPSFAHPIEYV
jgi:hypothetical protein